MEIITSALAGQYVYGVIDSNTLRNTVDELFPMFSKNLDADFISGFYHRYKGGHDLLIDLPQTFVQKGFVSGIDHAGHIILTDFPTKAGIPIPSFSQAGLGQYLESIGIHKGWLNINIMDGAIGFIAIAEGNSDLLQAIAGNLEMNVFTFFDTFIEGSLEIALGIYTQNPFAVVGGIENIFAGFVSTVKTLSIYVDPIDFFGAGITSAIIGTSLSLLLTDGTLNEKLNNSIITGMRSSTLGMMFTINSTFGFGLMGGYLSYYIGNYLANKTNKQISKQMLITEDQFELFFKAVKESNENFNILWSNIKLNEIISNEVVVFRKDLMLINKLNTEIIKLEENNILCATSKIIKANSEIIKF